MKLKNCVVGQRVQIKEKYKEGLGFFSGYLGQIAVIIQEPDYDGDVRVRLLDTAETDIGHHTNLRKIKE